MIDSDPRESEQQFQPKRISFRDSCNIQGPMTDEQDQILGSSLGYPSLSGGGGAQGVAVRLLP